MRLGWRDQLKRLDREHVPPLAAPRSFVNHGALDEAEPLLLDLRQLLALPYWRAAVLVVVPAGVNMQCPSVGHEVVCLGCDEAYRRSDPGR